MPNKFKHTLYFAAALVGAALLFSSCSSGSKIKSDVPMSELQSAVESAIDFDTASMHNADEKMMQLLTGLSEAVVEDYIMMLPTGTNQNEYGVFIAVEGSERAVSAAVADYLTERKANWEEQYLAEEKFKIDAGEYAVLGRYVYYIIGGREDFDNMREAIEKLVE
jgi:hypothetical protein